MVNHIFEIIKQVTSFKLSGLFRYHSSVIRTESIIFTLHSTVTVSILIVGTVFVTYKQYFGEPIECFGGKTPDISSQLLQHFCWMEGVFTVGSHFSDKIGILAGRDSAYAGVQPYNPHYGDTKIYHKYYQWVYFVLWIQSFLFYVPKYLWKVREDERLKNAIINLRKNHVLEISKAARHKLAQEVSDIIFLSNDFFNFVIICEIFYLIHLILQFWFTNVFLGGSFLALGSEWLKYSNFQEDRDPLIRVFPRLAKCNFHKYGFSGSVETYDALCFMSLNIVNEKVFVLLWFWYSFLFIVTAFHIIVYRTVILAFPRYRYKLLKSIAPTADSKFLGRICRRASNWFVLQIIAHHLRPYYFKDLIDLLQREYFDDKLRPRKIQFDDTSPLNGIAPSAPTPNTLYANQNFKCGATIIDCPPGPGFASEQSANKQSTNKNKNKEKEGASVVGWDYNLNA